MKRPFLYCCCCCFYLDLESEMYQLSHLLIEQRNLLATLKEDSLPEDQRHLIIDEEDGMLYIDISFELNWSQFFSFQ